MSISRRLYYFLHFSNIERSSNRKIIIALHNLKFHFPALIDSVCSEHYAFYFIRFHWIEARNFNFDQANDDLKREKPGYVAIFRFHYQRRIQNPVKLLR